MIDQLGTRMKEFYEDRTRIKLQRRGYVIIRVDGKAFKTYTKGLLKPFDDGLIQDMDSTATYLCKNIMGAKFAYVQSDEISILLTDFETLQTQAWFDNNLQKMCSVSASLATSAFNGNRLNRLVNGGMKVNEMQWANFDSRVFQIPSKTEVENYFIWRQQDATRNSISSVAQSAFSHSQLNGKSTDEMQEMLFQEKGINWNDFSPRYKRGRMIRKVRTEKVLAMLDETVKIEQIKKSNPLNWFASNGAFGIYVDQWQSTEVPIFTQERSFLAEKIPNN